MISKKIKITNVLLMLIVCLVLLLAYVGNEILIIYRIKHQNLILISVDTLRADHMGVYGYAKNTTPNIDKWAKDATVFTNAYTIYPSTLQSFYTFFTGRNDVYRDNYLINSNPEETMGTIFKKIGYKTVAFVTNPVVGEISDVFKKGFDQFNFIGESKIQDKYGLKNFTYDYQNSKVVTKRSIEWLNKNKDNNFFLWLHYTTPHMPYNPEKKYLCKIDKNCKNEVYEKFKNWRDPTPPIFIKSCKEGSSQNDILAMKNLYDAEILTTDEQIGIVLTHLKSLGLDKNSLIVFYGDHGEGFDHNIFGHEYSLYNSSIQIPFIIKNPYHNNGNKHTKVIDNQDMLPTILDLYKLNSINRKMMGTSIFSRKSKDVKKIFSMTAENKSNKVSLLDGRYKYIYSDKSTCLFNNNHEELYDLSIDRSEFNNLYRSKADLALKMKKEINDFVVTYKKRNNINQSSYQEEERKNKLKSLGY